MPDSATPKPNALIDLFLELQTLDQVPRSGFSLRGIGKPESVSEHSFHVVFLAWSLVSEEDLDRDRVVELALLHDLAEVRTGDLPRSAAHYLPKGAKRAAESAIARDLLAPLGHKTMDAFTEYQAKATPEARFVGACDRLQLLLKTQVYEDWGALGLGEFWGHLEDLEASEFATIRRLASELAARHQGSDR